MANIILKKSSVVGKVPTVEDLKFGELALNFADGRLYYKSVDNSIQSFFSTSTTSTLYVNNPTLSVSTTSGALVVAGGVGIGEDLYVGGQLYVNGISVGYGYTGSRGFTGSIGYTGSRGVQGVTGFTGSKGDQGVIGYTGSAGPIAGTNGQIIYNNGGIAGGSGVYYDDTNGRVGIGTSSPTTTLDIRGTLSISSNALVTNLNADLLDGVDSYGFIQHLSVIQPFNPFGDTGNKPVRKFYTSYLTDRFAGRTSQIYVTKDGVETSFANKAAIFDGSFDTSWTAAAANDPAFVVNLNFDTYGLTSSNGFVYSSGFIKLAFYPGRGPSAIPTARAKDRDGVWTNLTVTEDYIYGSEYIGYNISGLPGNYVTDIEITITPKSDIETRIAAIEYHGTRMGLTEGPLITTLGGTIYNNISGKFANSTTWSITPAGNAVFSTVNGGVVWTSVNDGSGSTLDADLLDGQQGSYYLNASNLNAGTVSTARLGSGTANNTTWLRGDGTWQLGPLGYTGSQGIQGVTGFTGSKGDQGVIGFTGSRGFTGSQGIQGVIGYTGSQGIQGVIGYTGSRGFTGSQGIQGVIGYTGSKGDQGVIGYTGSKGDQGVIGYTGSRGFTGSKGDQGYTGSVGPIAGSNQQFIYNDSGVANGANVYYDESNERVGIGTNTPVQKLEVRGWARFGLAGNDAGIEFEGGYGKVYRATSTGNIIIEPQVNTVFTTGDVGIGVASPVAKLHVGGDIAFASTTTGTNWLKWERTNSNSWRLNSDGVGEIIKISGNHIRFPQDVTVERGGLHVERSLLSDSAAFEIKETWNNTSTSFTAAKVDITDTASSSTSLLMDLQVGGSSRFNIDKSGKITLSDGTFPLTIDSTNGAVTFLQTPAITMQTSNAFVMRHGNSDGFNIRPISGTGETRFALIDPSNAIRAALVSGAPNLLELRNSTNAQTFNIYNTYTDSSNYERGFLKMESNYLKIGVEGAGTGSARSVSLMFGAAEKLRTTLNSVTTVDVVPFSNGTYDLGTSSLKWGELHVNDLYSNTLTLSPTWNDANTVFTGIKLNVTDTNSDEDSLLLDIISNNENIFQIGKTGVATLSGEFDFSFVDPPSAAPVATVSASAGNVTNTNIRYSITFVTDIGETSESPLSTAITSATNAQIELTSIPVSTSERVIARNIYRGTQSNLGAFYRLYIGTINDNTTTTFTDNVAVVTGLGTVGTNSPTRNTTSGKFKNISLFEVGSTTNTQGKIKIYSNNGTNILKQNEAIEFDYGSNSGSWKIFPTTNDFRVGNDDTNSAAYLSIISYNNSFTGIKFNGAGERGGIIADSSYRIRINTNDLYTGANSSLDLNNTSSGNVTLAQGGGNVGIGIASPTANLTVANGTNPVGLDFYNTYTDASNYERGFVKWNSNVLEIGVEAAGTGTGRNLLLKGGSNLSTQGNIQLSTGLVSIGYRTLALGHTSKTMLYSPSEGVLRLSDDLQNDFNRLQFGGTTSSFPSLKRSSTSLQVKLADDSAFTAIKAKTFDLEQVSTTSESTTLSTTTKTQIASFPASSFRSGKLMVQAYNSVTGEVQISEILVVHDGTTASSTEYGVIFTGASSIANYDVDISSSNVRLLATGSTSNSTQYKISEILMIA